MRSLCLTLLSLLVCSAAFAQQAPALLSGTGGQRLAPVPAGTQTQPPITAQPDEMANHRRIVLPPPGPAMGEAAPAAIADKGPVVTVVSSLAIVLGLFCGFVWVSRKTGNVKGGALGSDVFTVLGKSQIDARHSTALLKCGHRVLLVSLSQAGVHTLAEFTDPAEVNDLIAGTTGKSKQAFAQTLRELAPGTADVVDASTGQPTQERRGLFSHGV